MVNSADKHYEASLLEDIQHKLVRLAEAVAILPEMYQDVKHLKLDMGEVKDDIRIIKLVLTSHSSQLDNHENRISSLESSA